MTPALSCARERAVRKSTFYAKVTTTKKPLASLNNSLLKLALSCARERAVRKSNFYAKVTGTEILWPVSV
jgi:hypothetical protein